MTSTTPLAAHIAALIGKEKTTVKVGANVKDYNTETSTEITTHEITVDGEKVSYSSLKIEYLVENEGAPVEFTYVPYTVKTDVAPDSLYGKNKGKVDLKDKEITYHIYPVYRLSIPAEITAFNVVRYAVGTGLSSSGLEIFKSEEYKNGDKTVKALVEELAKVYKENYDAESDLGKLKKAYDDAAKVVKDKGDSATDEQIEKKETTLLAYREGQRAAIIDYCT